jgi:hypothetical protein
MTFLVWRQYRLQWAIALALLAAFAAVELTTGLKMASQWHSFLSVCSTSPQAGPFDSCAEGGGRFIGVLGNDLRVLSPAVPLVIGILWGAPLVAHEMETGTTQFAWTQGITRNRWLLVKVGMLLLTSALVAGAVSGLITWWSGPVNAMRGDQFSGNFFDTQGITPIGYAVFATALGIAAGALLRRTIAAIAVTFGGFIGVRLFFDLEVRQHLMPAVTTITSMTSTWSPSGIAWVLNSGALTSTGAVAGGNGFNGQQVNGVPISAMPAACVKLIPAISPGKGAFAAQGSHPLGAVMSCLQSAGFRQFVTYQPAWRYWPFQGIETGIYLLLAAALLAVTWYAVRRKDA